MSNRVTIILVIIVLLFFTGLYVLTSRFNQAFEQSAASFDKIVVEDSDEIKIEEFNSAPEALYQKALELDKKSDSLVDKLEATKTLLIETVSSDTDYDLNQPEINAEVVELKENIVVHRTWIETHYPGYISDLNALLNTSDSRHNGREMPWEEKYFHYAPLAAVVTLLTKMQADVRSIEGRIIDSLKVEMDKEMLNSHLP